MKLISTILLGAIIAQQPPPSPVLTSSEEQDCQAPQDVWSVSPTAKDIRFEYDFDNSNR